MTNQKIKEILKPFVEHRRELTLHNIFQLAILAGELKKIELSSLSKESLWNYLELISSNLIMEKGTPVNQSMLKYFIDSCLEEIYTRVTVIKIQEIKHQHNPFTGRKTQYEELLDFTVKINTNDTN